MLIYCKYCWVLLLWVVLLLLVKIMCIFSVVLICWISVWRKFLKCWYGIDLIILLFCVYWVFDLRRCVRCIVCSCSVVSCWGKILLYKCMGRYCKKRCLDIELFFIFCIDVDILWCDILVKVLLILIKWWVVICCGVIFNKFYLFFFLYCIKCLVGVIVFFVVYLFCDIVIWKGVFR